MMYEEPDLVKLLLDDIFLLISDKASPNRLAYHILVRARDAYKKNKDGFNNVISEAINYFSDQLRIKKNVGEIQEEKS